MPELPEVEVLVQHLQPLLCGKTVRAVRVFRSRILRSESEEAFRKTLSGGRFVAVRRRGKYLVFELWRSGQEDPVRVVGHLGMTGRLYLAPRVGPLPKHAAVVFDLGKDRLIFQDTRYFGRWTLDTDVLNQLGPEPLEPDFSTGAFAESLKRSRQPIKVKLLDQTVVAGIGNIYASEALFRARISPKLPSCRLKLKQVERLRNSIRLVLRDAIRRGSTIPLNFRGMGKPDGLFYFGTAPGISATYEERLRVYDRANLPCQECGTIIKRIVQAARSTFFCPKCQRK
jgi:formamidopyrimidine-DNA glycosylase